MGVVPSRRRLPSPPKRQIASLQQDGMSKFTVRYSDAVALARTIFICKCVKLGCGTHDIERVLSSVARAPLCRLTASGRIYFSKNANPMVLHLSGTCVSHRDTSVHDRGHDIIAAIDSIGNYVAELSGRTGSDIDAAITWMGVRLKGQLL